MPDVTVNSAATDAAALAAKAPIASPAFTGTVSGVTKSHVGLGSVDNVSAASLRDRSTHTGAQTSATISDFTEAVQDAVAALLGAGSNVTVAYNDAANTLTVSSSGGGVTDPEAVRDAIGVALVGVGPISIAVNDAADTITISTTATQNATDAALRDRSTHTGTQAQSTVTNLTTDLAGKAPTLAYDNVLAGSRFTILYGTGWPASRPSTRTSIYFDLIGGSSAVADPAWMLDGDAREVTS